MSFSDTDRLLARASPAAFAHIVSGGEYVPFDHLLLLDEHLTALAAGELRRLIVSMPPRHGKSETVSRYLPAWYLGRFPERRVMLASYAAALAHTFSAKARDLLAEFGEELFGVSVARRSAGAAAWELERRTGGMVAAGVGGPLTGRGAHLLVIDDPVKNAEDAASQTLRDKNWDWWRSTARTRLQKGGAVVLVMTRWHEDDLAGRLLSDGGEDWTVLELPALAERGDRLGRREGEALCPALFDKRALTEARSALGSYFWSALYQQAPLPADGAIFRRADFRYFRTEDDLYVLTSDGGERRVARSSCYHFATCDPALSSKETADYTALTLWAVTPERDLLLLEVIRERFEQPDQLGLIRNFFNRHQPRELRVEANAHGQALFQQLLREGLPVIPERADVDKVTRARGAVPRYEAHTVYHRQGADWLDAYEAELAAFPNAAHDDQVDCYTYAALALHKISQTTRKQSSHGETLLGDILKRRF